MYVNIRRCLDNDMTSDDISDLLDFVSNYTIHHGMIKGKIETMIWMLDVKDLGLFDNPLSLVFALQRRLRLTLINRGYNTLVVHMNPVLQFVAKAVISIFPYFSQKLFFYRDNGYEHLSRLVSDDNIEEKYGGKHPNIETGFFPPKLNL